MSVLSQRLGRQKDQTVIQEDNKWIDSPTNSLYAKSKYFAELEVFRGQEEGLSTTILNPSLILAAANWNKSSAQLFKYVWKQRPFYIDGYLNYVDVMDVASIVLSVSRIRSSRQNVSYFMPEIFPLRIFFEKVAKKFSAKSSQNQAQQSDA